jgi:hypothetical protein
MHGVYTESQGKRRCFRLEILTRWAARGMHRADSKRGGGGGGGRRTAVRSCGARWISYCGARWVLYCGAFGKQSTTKVPIVVLRSAQTTTNRPRSNDDKACPRHERPWAPHHPRRHLVPWRARCRGSRAMVGMARQLSGPTRIFDDEVRRGGGAAGRRSSSRRQLPFRNATELRRLCHKPCRGSAAMRETMRRCRLDGCRLADRELACLSERETRC